MKILQINSVCGIGSTGKIATDIHSILEKRGHESFIAYGRDVNKNCENSIKIGTKFDNYFHVLMTRVLDMHGFGSKNATINFIEKLKEINPDVIHLHNIHGYYINIEILFNFLKELNKPVIWTLHDCWAFTGHCAHFDFIECNKWRNGCNACIQKKKYPSSFIKDNSKYNYNKKKELFTSIKNMTIVTPSLWLANLVKESFLNKYVIKVINNGIDLNIFKPRDRSSFRKDYNLEEKLILLGVANVWDERKGLNYFIELAKLIGNENKIVLIGLNDKQIKNLPKNIIGIKRTNNVNELVEIYSTADIFINMTLEDNFPTVNLEALACGTPVITFDSGGSAECLDENCGFAIEKGNISQLLDAIERIKSNNINKSNCINRSKLYDKDLKFNEYIDLYMNQINFN